MKHLSKNRLAIGGSIAVLVLGLQVVQAEATPVAKALPKAVVVSESALRAKTLAMYHNADHLTRTQLVGLLSAVGFKGKDLQEAWAIAMKESRGNPLSHNGNRKTGDNSYGLFQVNMVGTLGPERRDKFNLDYNAELLDPVVNAKIAYHMSNGGKDWSAWKGLKTEGARYWMSQFPSKTKAKAIAKAKA